MKYFLIGFVLAVVAAGIFYFTLYKKPTKETNNFPAQVQTGLVAQDIVVGTGAEVKEGSIVTVNYVGTLLNGTKFDASSDHGQPFSFTLGQNQVIQGWEKGILGMKVGGKRKLTIPPDLAYGNRAVGTIPANSMLVFEVELLSVK